MPTDPPGLAGWTEEQIAQGRLWVAAWRAAGPELERLHRDELRRLDTFQTIALLCGPGDYRVPPRAPKPTSGLIDSAAMVPDTAPAMNEVIRAAAELQAVCLAERWRY